MPQVMTVDKIEVGGRTFTYESPTFDQEMYIFSMLNKGGFVGLDDIALDPATGILPSDTIKLLVTAYDNGVFWDLMAALFTEEGVEWTKQQVGANAALFRSIRDPDTKIALMPMIGRAIVYFFGIAVSSGKTFHTASPEVPSEAPSGRPAKTPTLSPEQAAEAFRSGHMPSSSKPSPTPTRKTRGTSSPGKSGKVSQRTKRS